MYCKLLQIITEHFFYRAFDHPIEDEVGLKSLAVKEIAKEAARKSIVRFLVKADCADVMEENGKFLGKAFAQRLD